MTTDQAAARDAMIATLREAFAFTETTAAHLVDVALDAERNNLPTWPTICDAVAQAADRGEAWANEALGLSTA